MKQSSGQPQALPMPLPRHMALVGPTAAGKTAAALALAQRWPVEIISVDSALVYRDMDIGTAKPSAAELAAVPHHLINIRDPLHAYSAAEFASDARRLMADISARGKLPLLVGGTMLYLKALREGLDDMPQAHPTLRAELQQQAAQLGWPALHAELVLVDPVTAARLHPADAQRIGRALEVYRVSGRPLSSFQTSKSIAANAGNTCTAGQKDPHASTPPNPAGNAIYSIAANAMDTCPRGLFDINTSDTLSNADTAAVSIAAGAMDTGASGQSGLKKAANSLLVSLEPTDRAWLHQRIAQRFDAMLAQGLLAEVSALRARGDLHPDLPAMRCVGYRQAWQTLDALTVPGANAAHCMNALRDTGIAATRQLAKRQITWLRATPARHVVACDAPDALAQVLTLAAAFFCDTHG